MTKARESDELRSKLQAHGKRRGVPCRILQNPCKTNTIQCAAQARHAEAARLGTHLTKKLSKTVEKQVNLAKPAPQQIQRGRAGPRARYADPSLLQRRMSKTLGKTKGNGGSLRSRCVM